MNQKISVCHLTSLHNFNDTRIYYKQCASLAAAGYQVTLIAPQYPWTKSPSDDNAVRVVFVKPVKSRMIRILSSWIRLFIPALNAKAEIYQFHDPELLPLGCLLRLLGKKVVYDVHEDIVNQILTKPGLPRPINKIISVMFNAIEKVCQRTLSGIITAAPFITQKYPHPIRQTLHNYPKKSYFSPGDVRDKTIATQVIYVGAMTPARGLSEMIAASLGANIPLELIGKLDPKLIPHDLIQNPKFKQLIKLSGYMDNNELNNSLQHSFAGLALLHPLPHYVNSVLSVKVYEYCLAGLPIIASNYPPFETFIKKYKCGITVDPKNTHEILKAIKLLNDNRELAFEMGQNGREIVCKKYCWDNEEQHLLNLYSQLATSVTSTSC